MPAGSLTLRSKIIGSILVVGVGSLLTAILSVQGPLRVLLEEHRAAEDAKAVKLLANEIAGSGLEHAAPIISRASRFFEKRVTLIAADGAVLFDSEKAPELLENHLHRREIETALANGTGWDERTSASVGKPFLYVAARIDNPGDADRPPIGYIRLATPLDQVEDAVDRERRALLAGALLAAMIAVPAGALAATIATRKLASMAEVADEIGKGELGRRIDVPADDEIGRIGHAVNLLADRLEEKLVRLTRDRALLLAVLDALGEGLAFVDERGVILASNGSFRKLAGTGMLPEGQLLRDVLREPAVDEAARRATLAATTTTAQAITGSPPREVRFRVTPTHLANVGTVALLVTEDLSANPRIEGLRVEAAAFLTNALATQKVTMPREGTYALALSRAAILLDEPAPPAEVVVLGELMGSSPIRAADEAPAVYVVRSRAEAALSVLRLELGLKEDDPLPATIDVEPTKVSLVFEPQKARAQDWTVPRSSEALDVKLRALAHRIVLAHLDAAGADVDDGKKKLVIGLPRA